MNTVFTSWKEIAQYLHTGVRTAQRREREMALPVRRPYGKQEGIVLVCSDDIAVWMSCHFEGDDRSGIEGNSFLTTERSAIEYCFAPSVAVVRTRRSRTSKLAKEEVLYAIAVRCIFRRNPQATGHPLRNRPDSIGGGVSRPGADMDYTTRRRHGRWRKRKRGPLGDWDSTRHGRIWHLPLGQWELAECSGRRGSHFG